MKLVDSLHPAGQSRSKKQILPGDPAVLKQIIRNSAEQLKRNIVEKRKGIK